MSSFIYSFLILQGVLFTLELFAFCPIDGHVFNSPQLFIQGFPESISPKGDKPRRATGRSKSALSYKRGNSIITKYKLKKYTGFDYRPLNASSSSVTTLANISDFFRKKQLLDTLQRINGTIASGVPTHFLKWRLVDDMMELLNKIESHEDLGTIMPPNWNDIHPANLYAGGLMRNYEFEFF
jgi:hypothetical protein